MFAHLHLHTEYSLLDGANRIVPLLDRIKELGMTSCAITDHGVMYGVVDFYSRALERGIHPVIGCEVYICPDMNDKRERGYSHLILLCENQTGYQNLIKLVSDSFTQGFYYKPRIDYAHLRAHSEGLIGLSACISGDLPRLLLEGREEDARKMALEYQSIFGEGNFFIELQDHGLPNEKQVLPRLIKLARATGIEMVITNDCHYLHQQDAEAQEALMCIQTGKTLADENRMRMETDQLYVKSEAEMQQLFPNFADALARTEEIAQRCNVTFDFKTKHLPAFPLAPGEEPFQVLRELCEKGLREKYAPADEAARARLDYELTTIRNMGYVDYFLIVWDFIRFARENGILVGPGRGSGAGSIVAYTLSITQIDPLRYNLVFERFLNPERVSMPDLDIDFDYERRTEVIDYVAHKYGEDHVAQIVTFGTMAAKLVIRDVARVMGISYQQADMVAKMVPNDLNMTLDKALCTNSQLRDLYDSDPTVKKLIDTARTLEGMPRHTSTHAAGVLITARPVSDYVPLQTNDEVITTQYPMGTLESLGLLKMDFLGLRTLNVIGDTLEMVAAGGGVRLAPEDIPLDDPDVYRMISDGDTDGVFQLEGAGMRQFLTNMKPENFEDIVAAISLYRPGPMESIPRYISGKRDPASVKYLTPELKPVLDVTYGCMVYQEQVMQIVRDLAGYSMGRSDLVRRAMSKKKHDVMEKEKEYFIHGKLNEDGSIDVPGAVRRGVSEEAARELFDEMTAFASYAFNKSHAAAYGVVAVRTAYLKLHHPVEFMAALMNSVAGDAGKVAYYIESCRKREIPVLAPDVNQSSAKFTVDNTSGAKGIRFGMNAVKNVGGRAIESIVAERKRSPYRSLADFVDRLAGEQVNKKVVESLIYAGAMDSLPGNRRMKLEGFERMMDGAQKRTKNAIAGQLSLFGGGEDEIRVADAEMPELPEFEFRTLLAMEKEMTGVYITGNPLDEYKEILEQLEVNSRFLATLTEGDADHAMAFDQRRVQMGGIIAEKKTKSTRSGNMMAFLTLEDLYGATEVLVFPRVLEKTESALIADSAVLLSGKLSVREDEAIKLLMDDVRPLRPEENAKAPPPAAPETRTLYLKINKAQQDAVSFILTTTPGSIRVVLRIADEKKTYLTPRNLWVSEDFDRKSLTDLLGAESVVLKSAAHV